AVGARDVGRVAGEVEAPVRARVRVLVDGVEAGPGVSLWTGEVERLWTTGGWEASGGRVRVRSAGREEVRAGELVEVRGWLRRPEGAVNPGAVDMREVLAGDRIFAEIRVPRAGGVAVVEEGGGAGAGWLAGVRDDLRGKLLEHTAREDVEAGYSMEAVLLGVREPVVGDVTRAFSDAGVAHLLAISGLHVVLVAVAAWGVLLLAPMRPRWREAAVVVVVVGYALATPCGPPVVRATIGVVTVAAARFLGRPRVTLNLLAVAAAAVLLWRPADLVGAGFQLSFVGTAGLVVFAERAYRGVFGGWVERERALAGLAGTQWARVRVRGLQGLAAVLVVNGIGMGATMPLVAFHFGQVNPLGVVTGIVAFPFVALTMVAGAVQVAAETCGAAAGAWAAPVTAGAGRLMIWVVEHLAKVPGAAVALRAPPGWLVALAFVVWAAWALRRSVGMSRAMVVNLAVGWVVVCAGWYAWTAPVGRLEMEVLEVGQAGSAMVVRTPEGGVWVVDAGSREMLTPMERAVSPALRAAGVRRIEGLMVMALDEVHGRDAGAVIERYGPEEVVAPAEAWARRGETRVGGVLEDVAGRRVRALAEGEVMTMGEVRVRAAGAGMFVWEYAGRRVVVVDGRATGAVWRWEQSGETCDALVVMGPESKDVAGMLGGRRVVRAGSVVRITGSGVSVREF
ncbi:MAG TPA: ComEC/Rec2 family competence protein, partial [Phycisphaerae bacterium]|nr:ComEC/Rec2 family competence protein [Phycisphaerae bacterium]